VTLTRYVCSDGKIVVSPEQCAVETKKGTEPVKSPLVVIDYTPITTNEDGTVIEKSEVKPTCVGRIGGYVYFKIGTVPKSVTFQIKEYQETEFTDIHSFNGVYEKYKYFAVCDDCKKNDFQLEPGKYYIFRIMFDQTPVYDRIEYSNEYIIDTREGSEIMDMECTK